ncbi:hypothetical protein, partial [Maricaulis sp.]|uniref:hypothetical protein n=1 Tax=Maricaulis sp. TaxID=1486257 RepID=UPI003299CDD5
ESQDPDRKGRFSPGGHGLSGGDVRDKCEIAVTALYELGPDFRQGDGACCCPNRLIFPGRKPA